MVVISRRGCLGRKRFFLSVGSPRLWVPPYDRHPAAILTSSTGLTTPFFLLRIRYLSSLDEFLDTTLEGPGEVFFWTPPCSLRW